VSTPYSFDKISLQTFEDKYQIGINFNHEQKTNLEKEGKTTLTFTQLSIILNSLCPTEESVIRFIENGGKNLTPIAMTLFVINDATWKLMKRKPEFPDKMLPMSTIPWFYWRPNKISEGLYGTIQRDGNEECRINFISEKNEVIISGFGGDFCGIVEGRLAYPSAKIRSLFLPGTRGSTKMVPRYEGQNIKLTIGIDKIKAKLYPLPEDILDYAYSEHPKIFYEHGMKIESNDKNVKLRVGSRSEYPLRGRIVILLGRPTSNLSKDSDILLFHLWLTALQEKMTISS
jgi:hypothetical protein